MEGMGEKKQYKIALFVDNPNIGGRYRLKHILDATEVEVTNEYKERGEEGKGKIVLKKIYFNPYVSPEAIKAADDLGFIHEVCSDDVDIKLATDAGGVITGRDDIDWIAIGASDFGYHHILNKAHEQGKNTLVLFRDKCLALINRATRSVNMREYMDRVEMQKKPEGGTQD